MAWHLFCAAKTSIDFLTDTHCITKPISNSLKFCSCCFWIRFMPNPIRRKSFSRGGTALRWIYGGTRFSEDLDFVTHLSSSTIRNILHKAAGKLRHACVALFGPGSDEMKFKHSRESAVKVFWIYRPDSQRRRIAVRLEFERLLDPLRRLPVRWIDRAMS